MRNQPVLYIEAEDGYSDEVPLPLVWEICEGCRGRGTSSAYLGAFTSDDFAEDPDFAVDYLDGQYDRACDECNGSGKVQVVDVDNLSAEHAALYEAQCEELAQMDHIEAQERAMGA